MVQFGVNANEAKVYKAHATPLGLCDNLINAFKLLANQRKDGDSLHDGRAKKIHPSGQS